MTSIATTKTQATFDRLSEIANSATFSTTIASNILAEFVVIPRGGLPAIESHHEEHVISCDRDTFYIPPHFDRAGGWEKAYQYVAVADYADQQAAKVDAAVEKLDTRRNELATELVAAAYGDSEFDRKYDRLNPEMKKAIDRIIELEEAAA